MRRRKPVSVPEEGHLPGQAPFAMVEWGLVLAWRMREEDDEGVGGLKQLDDMRSPHNWHMWARKRRAR